MSYERKQLRTKMKSFNVNRKATMYQGTSEEAVKCVQKMCPSKIFPLNTMTSGNAIEHFP